MMDRMVGDHGYVPSPQRELRMKFRPARPPTHADFDNARAQSGRVDYQMLCKAKQHEATGQRRVWAFLEFPFGLVDILIATNTSNASDCLRIFKVLDWDYVYEEGEMHAQLAELEASANALHAYLQDCACFPASGFVHCYLLLPRLVERPEDCDVRMICGEAACEQILKHLRLKPKSEQEANAMVDDGTLLAKLDACVSQVPQFDALYMRDGAAVWYGAFVEFEANPSLTRLANRAQTSRIEFEHAKQGLLAVPIALVSGVLGWEPTTRIHINNALNASVDVAPTTKLVFKLYGGGEITCEVNELDRLLLAKHCRETV